MPIVHVKCLTLRTLFLTVASLTAAGCSSSGPERATVTGTVTLDGAPIESGSIAFIPEGSTTGPTAGATIEDGQYKTLKGWGPVLGTHRVEIVAHRTGKEVEVPGSGGAVAGPSGASSVRNSEMFIPPQYNTKSTLTVTITSGTNKHDFPLKSI